MRLLRRTTRYAQVGLVCALLNNAIVIGLDHAGHHYFVAVIVAYLNVVLLGYLLHAAYTFQVRASRAGCIRFLAANLTSLPLSMLLMFMFCDGIGLSASQAMPIATVLLFFWNFLLAQWVIGKPIRPGF